MIAVLSPSDVEQAAQSLITAQKSNLGIEVSLPVIYPNGQLVTVAITVQGGEYVVHDAGFGAMYLTSAGARLTKQLSARLADLAKHYGCEYMSGRMSRRCSQEQLAVAIAMVANASRTVGDQALDLRYQTEQRFRTAVTERLRATVGDRLRMNEMITGKSGRRWRVANVVLDRSESKPIAFVSALANRSLVAPYFTEFYDLRGRYSDVITETVYDDSEPLRDEDRKLLEEVSELIPFSASQRSFERFRTDRLA